MRTRVYQLISDQFEMRPSMHVEDIYKLLYQSCMGLGHLIQDREKTLSYLESEMEKAVQSSSAIHELVTEDITLIYPLYRVNLRPLLAKEPDRAGSLFQAMLATEEEMRPSHEDLVFAWYHYVTLENENKFSGKRERLLEYDQYLVDHDFPVQHHSATYRECYNPSYRIISKRAYLKWFDRNEGVYQENIEKAF